MRDLLNEKYKLQEAVLQIDEDVEFIFKEGGFEDFIKKYNDSLEPDKDDILRGNNVVFTDIDSNRLKSIDGLKASLLKPVKIYCGIFNTGNYYQPSTNRIQISFAYSALDVIYSNNLSLVTDRQMKTLKNEITDFRIKASISHELSHWISDVKNNSYLSNILFKATEFNRSEIRNLGLADVNMTYFEIDAQIHALLPIYKKYKDRWNFLNLSDVFELYPSLSNINNTIRSKYGAEISKIWQKNLIKRMHREGILGDRMRKFVNY